MASLLDNIGAALILGTIIVLMLTFNMSMNQNSYQATIELLTQEALINTVRMIEFDFYKIGHGVPDGSGSPFVSLGQDSIVFKADINDDGTVNTVTYALGPASTSSGDQNPNVRPLYRVVDGTVTGGGSGVTQFQLTYQNAGNNVTSVADSVRSTSITLRIESPFAYFDHITNDFKYAVATWESLIYHRNIQ